MKKLIFIVLVGIIGLTFVLKDKEAIEFNINAKAIILIDAETNKVLYEKNSKEALPIASMSKLMTEYIVLNAIEEGILLWETAYEPSEHVQKITGLTSAAKMGMTPGNVYSVEELFTAMTVNSSNDAAIALAELMSGTEEKFAELMNEQAKSLGLKESTFFNASGLDGDYVGKGKEQTNKSSARDVSVIAQKLLAKHPEVLDFSGLTNYQTNAGDTAWSTNLMLPGMPQAFAGIDGLKTGYTDEAGSCFASTGVFNGKRVITVVIDVEAQGKDTVNPKFELTRELIEHYVINE